MSLEKPRFTEDFSQRPQEIVEGTISRETAEKKGLFERLRKSPIRGPVLALALQISSFGPYIGEKVGEKREIEREVQRVTGELNEWERVEEKYNKLKLIFGDRPSFLQEKVRLQEAQEEIEHLSQTFSFFQAKRSIDTKHIGLERKKTEQEEPIIVENFNVVDHQSFGDSFETREPRKLVLSQETLREVLETFPQTWIHGEIGSIRQTDEIDKVSKSYGIEGYTFASCSDLNEPKIRAAITFYRQSQESDAFHVISVLGHEIAHTNDWDSDNEATLEERTNLLLAIAGRLEADDRYMSSYVESIKNDDKQLEKFRKAKEYWAEICEAYFGDPDSLHYEDFRVVDEYVKRGDPNFAVEESTKERLRLIFKGVYGIEL